jgi:hypothetical protein
MEKRGGLSLVLLWGLALHLSLSVYYCLVLQTI